MEHLHYPNESAEYRAARNALLDDEITLRAQIEAVAAKRRALPLGGEVSEDYVFERIGKTEHAGESGDVRTVRTAWHARPVQFHVWARTRAALSRLHSSA